MSLDLTGDKSTLLQVMAWCRQATSHYLSQWWPRSLLPYGVTRPQWVNFWHILFQVCQHRHNIGLFKWIYKQKHNGSNHQYSDTAIDTLSWYNQPCTYKGKKLALVVLCHQQVQCWLYYRHNLFWSMMILAMLSLIKRHLSKLFIWVPLIYTGNPMTMMGFPLPVSVFASVYWINPLSHVTGNLFGTRANALKIL